MYKFHLLQVTGWEYLEFLVFLNTECIKYIGRTCANAHVGYTSVLPSVWQTPKNWRWGTEFSQCRTIFKFFFWKDCRLAIPLPFLLEDLRKLHPLFPSTQCFLSCGECELCLKLKIVTKNYLPSELKRERAAPCQQIHALNLGMFKAVIGINLF